MQDDFLWKNRDILDCWWHTKGREMSDWYRQYQWRNFGLDENVGLRDRIERCVQTDLAANGYLSKLLLTG